MPVIINDLESIVEPAAGSEPPAPAAAQPKTPKGPELAVLAAQLRRIARRRERLRAD